MIPADLHLASYEARIKFTADAYLPEWSSNTLRDGFGARLKEIVCIRNDLDCADCPHVQRCVYVYFYNSKPPVCAQILKKLSDVPSPFAFEPPRPGKYWAGNRAVFGFKLFGKGIEYRPYFLVALQNLGESGLSRGYRKGLGKFALESVDSLGYGKKENIFSGDTVYNRSIILSYEDMLKAS